MSSTSLTGHLTQLRRDLTQHYVEYISRQPVHVEVSSAGTFVGAEEHKLTIIPSPPNDQDLMIRLDGLSTVLTFLDEHLFPHIPLTEKKSFLLTLCRPVRGAVLNHILMPALPSSLNGLSQFLDLVTRAQKFELDYLSSMLGDDGGDQEIASWARDVGMHYERKRRTHLLDSVRVIVMRPEDDRKMIAVDIEVKPEFDEANHSHTEQPTPIVVGQDGEDDAWGLYDDGTPAGGQVDSVTTDDDGWGFGDEESINTLPESQERVPFPPLVVEDDPDDAWGLNADDDPETLDGDQDDPWNDRWDSEKLKQPAQAPKLAKGLAKLTSKGKNGVHKADDPPMQSPIPVGPPPPTPLTPSIPRQPSEQAPVLKETYMVSGRTRELLEHIEVILREGEALVASGLFASLQPAAWPTGFFILQAAPLAMDVFRAVYPVTFSAVLQHSPKQAMRFSNDCLHLSTEVQQVRQYLKGPTNSVSEKLQECCERLKLLGESWYSDTTVRHSAFVIASLLMSS